MNLPILQLLTLLRFRSFDFIAESLPQMPATFTTTAFPATRTNFSVLGNPAPLSGTLRPCQRVEKGN